MKRLILLIALFALFLPRESDCAFGKPLFSDLIEKRIDLWLFHSEECGKCRTAIPGLVSLLNAQYPQINVKVLDLKNPENYEFLRSLEKQLGRRAEELPVAVLGSHILCGEKEIAEKIDSILIEHTFNPTLLPVLPESKELISKGSQKKIQVNAVYFYKNGCPKCGRTELLLHHLTKRYPGLSLTRIDLSTPEGMRLNEAYAKKLNIAEKERLTAPSLVIGKYFLAGKDLTDENVEKILLESPSDLSISEEELYRAKESIVARFESLSAIPVALAGLVDGFNPCAFAALVFLLSFLTFKGRDKREVLKIGLGYTAAVFVTYLLIGFGIFSFARQIASQGLSKGVYLFTGFFAVAVGILNFYDYLLWKRGREKEMKLQLPTFLKRLIHRSIRSIDWTKYYLPGSVLLGFTVSLFEFTCTGQVYLPTILFVMKTSLGEEALLYLGLYNLAFVSPLVGVFGLFYAGISQERFVSFLRKRGPLVKLMTAGVFFFIGGGILLAS